MNTRVYKPGSEILFRFFKELGQRLQLSFSSQLVLADMLIGIDGISRKLLLVSNEDGISRHNVLDLADVEECSLYKKYSPIPGGALKTKNINAFVERVGLKFVQHNREEVFLPFYTRGLNSLDELRALEQKARDWTSMFTKMLTKEKRA
jgi:hypothetical protein